MAEQRQRLASESEIEEHLTQLAITESLKMISVREFSVSSSVIILKLLPTAISW